MKGGSCLGAAWFIDRWIDGGMKRETVDDRELIGGSAIALPALLLMKFPRRSRFARAREIVRRRGRRTRQRLISLCYHGMLLLQLMWAPQKLVSQRSHNVQL